MTGDRRGLALRATAVRVLHGERAALDGVDLEIHAGERVALVGPSGAGKTTLLRALGAAIHPTSGAVHIGGLDPASAPAEELRALRCRLGFLHQDHALVPNLRVAQNVLAGRIGELGRWAALRLALSPPRRALEEVHELLERLGVEDLLFQRVDRLSGGEAQRVALARALHQRAQLLLLDEPVAALDPERARSALAVTHEHCAREGTTLVASLHHLEHLRAGFDRVVGLRGGSLVFEGRPEELDEEQIARLYGTGQVEGG